MSVYLSIRSPLARSLLAAMLLFFGGCATTDEFADPRDPLEGFNRGVYAFNEQLDRYLLKPAAEGYVAITPRPVQRGIGNFFSNLGDVGSAANNLLQLKVGRGLSDIGRVLINSTLGIGGIMDLASGMDLPRYNEDFGQTLGYWGIEPGPYLVLPLLGASSFRDTVGLVGDWYLDPLTYLDEDELAIALRALDVVELRAQLLSASDMLEQAAVDPYAFTRDAYLQRRLDRVYDGNPPLDFDEELFE